MRPLEFAALGLILLLAGCGSQSTKPLKVKASRDYEATGPDYSIHSSRQVRQRDAVRDYLGLASARLSSGDLAAAEQSARKALKLDSSSADAYTLLAIVESQRGDAKQAGVYYKRAVDLAPTEGGKLNNYGSWLCGNGFPAESLLWFDRALADERYGTPAAALANAGACALQAGQKERARNDLRRAVELDPVNAYALESLAMSEYQAGRYLEARAFVERRLAAAPATASVLQLATWVEEKLGDKAAAARYRQRMSRDFPNDMNANSGAAVP